MQGFTIRKAEQRDVESVYKLQVEWCSEDITYGFEPASAEYLSSKLGEYFLVAEKDTEIIGFVYGSVREAKNMAIFVDGQKYFEIDDVYISSAHRNSGAGGSMLDAILDTAKTNGIEKSYVYSATKDSERVMNFYKEHGYKTWCVRMFK